MAVGRVLRGTVGGAIVAAVVVVGGAACGTDDSAMSSTSAVEPVPTVTVPEPVATDPTTTTTAVPADIILFDFADPASVAGWSTQNDTVMGGVSSATVAWADGAMVFSGELSLANNGGFTSAVSPQDPGLGVGASETDALVINGTGDSRTYLVQLRGGRNGQQRWTQPFTLPTTPGEVTLPINAFEATDFMLDPVAPEPVDPSTITAVAIYLVDNQPGPFGLSVTSLAARQA
jgi:hypothetical protein